MRQHYITRAYLRGFCDPTTPPGQEPWVWVSDLQEGKVKRRAPKNVATRPDYYSVKGSGGTVEHAPERLLSVVESGGARVVAKLREGLFTLASGEREQLALFIGFLITRTPAFRDFVERAAGKYFESVMRIAARHPEYFRRLVKEAAEAAGETVSDEEIEDARLRGLDPPCHFIVRGTPEFSLGQALVLATTPAAEILNMRWEFEIAGGKEHFVTGDVPVTWRNPRVRPPVGAGLRLRSTEVSFPISPYICLRGTWTGAEGVRDVALDDVRDLNRERVRHADRFIFSDNEDMARAASQTHQILVAAGESPIVPFGAFIIEEGEFRDVSAEIARERKAAR